MKKAISKGKFLYTCFVDFRKAYGSIYRKRQLHRLEEIGLIGKIIDMIKSMYKSPKVSLIHQDKISQTFLPTIVLKQGDVLRTILFNICINDLPRRLVENSQSLDTLNDIPYLDETKINNLVFADDLAIFSLSKEDLQKRVSILEQYSNEWGLELNLIKTKIMTFEKQGSTIRKFKFYFQGQEIEIVKQYTYLGFTFMPSGKKHQGIENLINKAKKSWLTLQRFLCKSERKTVNTYLNLIDTTIKPVVLYVCKSWGDPKDQNNLSKIEKFNLSLCKQIPGVKNSTSSSKI